MIPVDLDVASVDGLHGQLPGLEYAGRPQPLVQPGNFCVPQDHESVIRHAHLRAADLPQGLWGLASAPATLPGEYHAISIYFRRLHA